MADTVKSSSELKLVYDFYDGDTRTMTLENPKSNLTSASIKAVATLAAATHPIIGDKGGAAVVGISNAKTISKTTTYLDLTIV